MSEAGDAVEESIEESKPVDYPLLPKIVNGSLAGICGICCTFPLDLVKTRLQKQQVGPDGKKMYNSMVDAFMKTYRSEGLFGMYRGVFITGLFVTPENCVKLVGNDFFRHHLGEKFGPLALHRQFIAGGLAGFSQGFISTPRELLKIQMQDYGRIVQKAEAAGKTVKRLTTVELVSDIIKKSGFFGMYKGVGPTMLRDITFSLLYFPLFHAINAEGPKKPDGSGEAQFWWSFASGFMAAAIVAFTVTPLDVLKTRIQTVNTVEGERTYSGMRDAFTKILQYEGPTALFKGGSCRVIVVAPLFGITQGIYYLGVAEHLLGYKK